MDEKFNWYAKTAQLRDLRTEEKYRFGLGGINVPNGDNQLQLRETPNGTFNFIDGDRLSFWFVVEGDMIGASENYGYNSDIHLLLLPVMEDGVDFFELLFQDKLLLENLTMSVLQSVILERSKATALLIYNNTFNVEYSWDRGTGLLLEKIVTAPSGLKLHVKQGERTNFFGFRTIYLQYTIASIIGIFVIIKVIKRQRSFQIYGKS